MYVKCNVFLICPIIWVLYDFDKDLYKISSKFKHYFTPKHLATLSNIIPVIPLSNCHFPLVNKTFDQIAS